MFFLLRHHPQVTPMSSAAASEFATGGPKAFALPEIAANSAHQSAESRAQAEEARRVWQQLDDLARTDPQEYRRVIDERLRQGRRWEQMAARVVHRGLCVKCHLRTDAPLGTGNPPPRRHYINICQSMRMECPQEEQLAGWRRSELTVPMVLDDPRLRIDAQNVPYCVYDVIIHPEVYARMEDDIGFLDAVVRLAMQSIEQTFQLKFKSAGYKRVSTQYKGPFQWRSDGQKLQLASNKDADTASKGGEPDEILDRVLRPGIENTHATTSEPSIQLSTVSSVGSNSTSKEQALLEIIEYRSVPKSTMMSDNELQIELPKEQNSGDFTISVTSEDMFLQTPHYVMFYVFSNPVNPDKVSASFSGGRVLSLTWAP